MDGFSDREQKILKILGRKKMTYFQISDELFKKGVKPFEAHVIVASTISRIIKKCSYYDKNWTLKKIRENKRVHIKKEAM